MVTTSQESQVRTGRCGLLSDPQPRAIEFLLVRTRNRKRWTFPKGSAEPRLSHAQVAALEAFEEAGVRGRIEETPFTEYLRYRRCDKQNLRGSTVKRLAVSAHLCEVLRLCQPKESNRNRTWFSVQDTRQSLRQGRGKEDGDEFARVVDRALRRIQRLEKEAGIVADRPRLQPDGPDRMLTRTMNCGECTSSIPGFVDGFGRIANRVRLPKTPIGSRS
jgi:8-oxo-dGTP pyrophosphatase MutT (NUDIX family)